jgi:short-subunit dehydrogenase
LAYALITGASKGIGKAIAEELASKKIDLLMIARSQDLLQQTAKSISEKFNVKTDYLATDLSSSDAAQKVFDWCCEKNYEVEILVNNAGYGLSGLFEKYTADETADMMRVNMLAPVLLCRTFLPMLKQQKKAYILNIASSAAYQAVPYLSVYAASKAFVLNYSRGLRQELRKTNVSVTAISPGSTDTDFVVRAQVGEKGLQTAKKVNMTPTAVAKIAVKSMFAQKPEVIAGFINKLGAFMAWLAPKNVVEKTAMKIYE